MTQEYVREGGCVACGECCRLMRITTVLSNLLIQHGSLDEARAYYSYRGFRITEIDQRADIALLEADIPCNQLTAGNRCALHDTPEKKPVICHRYPLAPDDIESCGFTFRKASLIPGE